MGLDVHKALLIEVLVRGDDAIFAAAGVTDGKLLKEASFIRNDRLTYSVVMRAK